MFWDAREVRRKSAKNLALELHEAGVPASYAPQFQVDFELTDRKTKALAKELARLEAEECEVKVIRGHSVREVALEMYEGGWTASWAPQFQADYELTDGETKALEKELRLIETEMGK